jgi:tetratricopeptide (TPR) repeat protein
MKAASISGQAGYFASKGEYEKAGNLYQEAVNVAPSNGENPDYLLNSGINYFKAGRYDEAKMVLEKLKQDFQPSATTREAEKYIVQLTHG